jgi:hypothetical protein
MTRASATAQGTPGLEAGADGSPSMDKMSRPDNHPPAREQRDQRDSRGLATRINLELDGLSVAVGTKPEDYSERLHAVHGGFAAA